LVACLATGPNPLHHGRIAHPDRLVWRESVPGSTELLIV